MSVLPVTCRCALSARRALEREIYTAGAKSHQGVLGDFCPNTSLFSGANYPARPSILGGVSCPGNSSNSTGSVSRLSGCEAMLTPKRVRIPPSRRVKNESAFRLADIYLLVPQGNRRLRPGAARRGDIPVLLKTVIHSRARRADADHSRSQVANRAECVLCSAQAICRTSEAQD